MPEAFKLLDPDRIEAGAGNGRIGRKVVVYRETSSTNDVVSGLAEAGEDEGIVVFAERQREGRGQFGRKWVSADGAGLWFSILLRPLWPSGDLHRITPLVAVAVAEAVESETRLPARIKPPNDIMIHGRKAVGILTEARTGRRPFAVVGIGVNVNQVEADFPLELRTGATSLRTELDRPVDREAVAGAILKRIGGMYAQDRPPGPAVEDAFRALSQRPVCDSFAA